MTRKEHGNLLSSSDSKRFQSYGVSALSNGIAYLIKFLKVALLFTNTIEISFVMAIFYCSPRENRQAITFTYNGRIQNFLVCYFVI